MPTKNNNNNKEWTLEDHPDWYRDVSPMHYLILGSFPPHPDRQQYPFYYPNRRNRLWPVLAELAALPLQWRIGDDPAVAVAERYRIMQQLQVGVQNLGLQIERRGMSALDTDIRIVRFQPVISILESHPELRRILLPGFAAPHSTARSFARYIEEQQLGVCATEKIQLNYKFDISFARRRIECVILNSTSTASRVKYATLLEQFRQQLAR